MPCSPEHIQEIFGPKGLFASHLAGYEFRQGQLDMALAVADLLASDAEEASEHQQAASLIVEAETGLGKTLAYLVPAVLSGERVVISTNTRNLQDQILEREIPLIRKLIDPQLRAMVVKGRQNYACLYRWHQLQASRQLELIETEPYDEIENWLDKTIYGERSELDWLSSSSALWQKICCQSHFCLGSNCPEYSACCLNRLRRDAAASRLLIVNHHLLFSDLAVRKGGFGEVLPRYGAVIFDEAHHVEEVATLFFGTNFSRHQVMDFCADVERSAQTALKRKKQKKIILRAITLLSGLTERFAQAFPQERGRFPLQTLLPKRVEVLTTGQDLLAALVDLHAQLAALPLDKDGLWTQYAARSLDLAARLKLIMTDGQMSKEKASHVHWFERGERNVSLFASPIDVAQELQTSLFDMVRACVFTSATLGSGGRLDYFRKSLGLFEQHKELVLPSPFNYRQRTLLYVPDERFPEVKAPGYQQALHASMLKLVRLAMGRSLLLFTSFSAMEAASELLRAQLEYPVLVQGQAPRQSLLRAFTRETESVLLAVSSFWEGIDVPGESLSLVIIDKLPFEVPTDPVIMARTERIRARGGHPFNEFQVPRAILALRQGVGRLMRASDDRGVIAILDVRLFSKGYGRRFLHSLPPSPVTRNLDEVSAFFDTYYGTTKQ